jgi:hypothetical protein
MEHTIGLPHTVLADAGFASGAAVAKLEAKKVEPLVAIKTQPHRPPARAGAGSTTSARRPNRNPSAASWNLGAWR